MIALIVFTILGTASADIVFEPVAMHGDLSIDTLIVEGTEYHLISLDGFSNPTDGMRNPGLPSVPFTVSTFLLPPDIRIDTIEILSTTWDTLPGKYYLYPAQTGLMTATAFISPDQRIYSSSMPFPEKAIEVSRQGSAMGYSVASLTGTPIRYIPADSTLMILSSIIINIQTESSESERIFPNRETEFSSAMRERGILSLISNPENIACYQQPVTLTFEDRMSPLNITPSPSSAGDGVDMVIITSSELADDFEQVADYRTRQGIITVVRTVEWIDQFYSGCDTPERIRNFIRDAHEEWGIQAVLLGGDDGVVPVRECGGWNYTAFSFPTFQIPSDDYYADIDGNWSYAESMWNPEFSENYLDLCSGRWPVNDGDDVYSLFAKLQLYEQPEFLSEDFARKLLLIGSNEIIGNGADDMMYLVTQLENSSAIPRYLDDPTELYFPHSLPGGDLCRSTALSEFDQGYNLIVHADHAEVHKLATAGKNTLGQFMWDSDFATMGNFEEPSILWTIGCDIGHFDGTFCFAEAGLLTSASSGLVAMIANARYGLYGQKFTYYAFCDALFNTGYIADHHGFQALNWPLCYLGEAHRCSKNIDGIAFPQLNLLGSPLMYVWRDNPESLLLSVPRMYMREGVSRDIAVIVTDGTDPVESATVCLWKKDEVFSIEETNALGQAIFEDICIVDGSGDQDVVITAVKRRREINQIGTTVVSYIPDQVTLDVLPADIPIVSLEDFSVDVTGDGTPNPGEFVDIYITAKNSGAETALNVSAELSLVSGGEYIKRIPDDQTSFPDIAQDQTEDSTDPFTIVVNSNVESYSTVVFNVTFSYFECSGQLHQWESPLFLTIYSEGYALTVVDPTADNSSGNTAEILLSNMFLANCGLGEGNDLEITVDNLFPTEPFNVNTLICPGMESNEVSSLSGQIVLTVMPKNKNSAWLMERFPECSFDVVVSSDGGNFVARIIDVELVDQLQDLPLDPPVGLQVYETGQDYISLVWDHDGQPGAEGFYIYYNNGVEWQRAYPLPVPVEQATIEGLLPGRQYAIEVTAVDAIGRESEPATTSISTTCPAVDGWPIQLAGSPGCGPAIADIDRDGFDEIIVATSFGLVYIINRDGSYQALGPPPGYDFDKFLGCAVGDVDDDSWPEIVVTCQKNFEIQNQEQVTVLLYDMANLLWTVSEIAVTEVNEQAATPVVAGTPVLFQADTSRHMEIALRTKGHNGGTPHLYAWRYDSELNNWVSYSADFPVPLTGYFFTAPTAVDFDKDGYEELIVTTWGSGSVGTALKIVDFESDGNVSISVHNLPELDTEGKIARAFGTLAAAEENNTCYIVGSAKSDILCSTYQRVFTYSLQSDPVDVTFVWETDWMNGRDFFGNLTGPAIGDLDGDSELEVIYTFNGGQYQMEGKIFGWNLSDGTETFQSSEIPFNPIIAGGGADVKSQPVVGLTALTGIGGMAIFSGFSSLCCGHDPQSGSSMLEGFPVWTRDIACASPAICDLDIDGFPEVLHIDYSGFATLFDWDEGSYTSEGWHMYQDNSFRNGFYNTTSSLNGLDISISGSPHIAAQRLADSNDFCLLAEVEISGTHYLSGGEPAPVSASRTDTEYATSETILESGPSTVSVPGSRDRTNRADRSSVSTAAVLVIPCRTVEIAVFCRERHIGSATIMLEEGSHQVRIPLRYMNDVNDSISVVIDPFNEYREIDETNNVSSVEGLTLTGNVSEVVIPSPAGAIELTISLPSALPEGLKIRVYSIAGRLVTSLETEALHSGLTSILPDAGSEINRLSAGMYMVCISGLESGDTVRKVIILDR